MKELSDSNGDSPTSDTVSDTHDTTVSEYLMEYCVVFLDGSLQGLAEEDSYVLCTGLGSVYCQQFTCVPQATGLPQRTTIPALYRGDGLIMWMNKVNNSLD